MSSEVQTPEPVDKMDTVTHEGSDNRDEQLGSLTHRAADKGQPGSDTIKPISAVDDMNMDEKVMYLGWHMSKAIEDYPGEEGKGTDYGLDPVSPHIRESSREMGTKEQSVTHERAMFPATNDPSSSAGI